MLTLLLTTMLTIICSHIVYYKSFYYKKIQKFSNLMDQYIYEDPDISYYNAFYKSINLVIKTNYYDLYQSYTSFKTKKYIFTKIFYGGNKTIIITPITTGPKKNLEYGYIDNKRMDNFFTFLLGINKDFSGYNKVLLEFGNEIRYKFMDEEEIKLSEKGNIEKKIENLHSIIKHMDINN